MRKIAFLAAVIVIMATAMPCFGLEKMAVSQNIGQHDYSLGQACSIIYYNSCRWLWVWSGWAEGDVAGVCYNRYDEPTCEQEPSCETLDSGYQYFYTAFPGYGFVGEWTVFDVNEECCIIGGPMAGTGPYDPTRGWNFFDFDPNFDLGLISGFTWAVTWTWLYGTYPTLTLDNEYHDLLDPANCPGWVKRTATHAFWYGTVGAGSPVSEFPMCPPYPIQAVSGYYDEMFQDLQILCEGPTATEQSSWGRIKAKFR